MRCCGFATSADVLVESFRPGVAARLGVGYEAVSARNPRIVYCSITAFGQDGAYGNRPAHDLALEALTGVLGLTLGDDGRPAIPGIPIADVVSALQGLSGVLMALLRRAQTGRGDYIDIAMHDSLFAACANVVGPAIAEGRATGRQASALDRRLRVLSHLRHARRPPARAGRAGAEVRPRAAAKRSGGLDLEPLCARGPGPHQQPVIDFLRDTFLQRSLAEWMAFLSALDVCFAP